ncbi:heterokaryon incompatibility protein-domain-containing protein [Whalleya microplaca]|nr:heterokaryon incompatibility protein-domain-containing protein [Whalleya microplaca]
MPARLIELGYTIRLVDSATIHPSPYVAPSRCWGSLKGDAKFCTFNYNIGRYKISIDFNSLSSTFKDAISVVRGLGLRYLWIDSLCIIQDDKLDWENEAASMEQVSSGAYFTIAASSAKSSCEGFLSPRKPRPCVQLSMQSMRRLYVCPYINNFHVDTELGNLNGRGWVLQERVLSRCSIYFSSTLIYWECVTGVHCEALMRLHNPAAAFYGDANFPESALKCCRDGRQVLVQDLYERYSGLAFTNRSDRFVAILGLQNRLARALRTKAAFGFFAIYFARGLLMI